MKQVAKHALKKYQTKKIFQWFGQAPLQLESLTGKVLLIL